MQRYRYGALCFDSIEALDACLASFQRPILHVSCIAEAHVRPGADTVRTSVGTVWNAVEGTGFVEDVSSLATAHIRSSAFPIKTRTVAGSDALLTNALESWLTGACFRCSTNTVEAATAANRLTANLRHLIAHFTLANSRCNASPILAASVTVRSTFVLRIEQISFTTLASLHIDTTSLATTSGTLGNTQLAASSIQLVTLVAATFTGTDHTVSMITSDRARRNAPSLHIPYKVRIALAGVRSNAQPILARFLAYGLTLTEVVNVTLVSATTNLDAA